MNRRKASDYDPRVLELFDKYVHGGLSRRDFLDRAASVTAGGVAASTLLADYALAQEVPEGDPRIKTARIEYQSPQGYGTVKGLLARPANVSGKLPGVLVVHENRGLNPYIEDVARRLGAEGYLALAPDGLTSLGGYPGNDDEGRAMQAKLDRNKLLEDFIAGVKHLQKHGDCTGKVGAVGFCYGGGICNALAVRIPDLAAAVPFYGSQPPAEETPNIHAPLMLHYAGDAALRRERRARQRRVAALRGRAQGERQDVRGLHVSRHEPRLPQRFDAALRRRGGEARLGAHAGVLRQASELSVGFTARRQSSLARIPGLTMKSPGAGFPSGMCRALL